MSAVIAIFESFLFSKNERWHSFGLLLMSFFVYSVACLQRSSKYPLQVKNRESIHPRIRISNFFL